METVVVKVEQSGRVLIPASWRRKLGVQPGQDLILAMEDDRISVVGTRLQAVRRAQELVRKYIPEGRILSEELSAEREEEARREARD